MLGANWKLFAAQFEGEEENERGLSQNAFSKLKSDWNDPEWLRSFFLTFKKDYYRFYGSKSAGNLVRETLSLADDLFEVLMTATISGNLSHLFKPLDNSEFGDEYDFQKLKAKGEERKSYLRIYAIRYGDEFVISGGAIKLTNYMDDRLHTKLEKYKLEAVVTFLKQKDLESKIVYLDS